MAGKRSGLDFPNPLSHKPSLKRNWAQRLRAALQPKTLSIVAGSEPAAGGGGMIQRRSLLIDGDRRLGYAELGGVLAGHHVGRRHRAQRSRSS